MGNLKKLANISIILVSFVVYGTLQSLPPVLETIRSATDSSNVRLERLLKDIEQQMLVEEDQAARDELASIHEVLSRQLKPVTRVQRFVFYARRLAPIVVTSVALAAGIRFGLKARQGRTTGGGPPPPPPPPPPPGRGATSPSATGSKKRSTGAGGGIAALFGELKTDDPLARLEKVRTPQRPKTPPGQTSFGDIGSMAAQLGRKKREQAEAAAAKEAEVDSPGVSTAQGSPVPQRRTYLRPYDPVSVSPPDDSPPVDTTASPTVADVRAMFSRVPAVNTDEAPPLPPRRRRRKKTGKKSPKNEGRRRRKSGRQA